MFFLKENWFTAVQKGQVSEHTGIGLTLWNLSNIPWCTLGKPWQDLVVEKTRCSEELFIGIHLGVWEIHSVDLVRCLSILPGQNWECILRFWLILHLGNTAGKRRKEKEKKTHPPKFLDRTYSKPIEKNIAISAIGWLRNWNKGKLKNERKHCLHFFFRKERHLLKKRHSQVKSVLKLKMPSEKGCLTVKL